MGSCDTLFKGLSPYNFGRETSIILVDVFTVWAEGSKCPFLYLFLLLVEGISVRIEIFAVY